MCIRSPLLTPQSEQYLLGRGEFFNTSSPTSPLLSSTPFRGPGEDSTLQEATAITLAKLNEASTSLQRFPVDMIVKNPLFGSGLTLEKVNVRFVNKSNLIDSKQANRTIVNKYFGKGIPNYEAASRQKGKWVIQVQGDGYIKQSFYWIISSSSCVVCLIGPNCTPCTSLPVLEMLTE